MPLLVPPCKPPTAPHKSLNLGSEDSSVDEWIVVRQQQLCHAHAVLPLKKKLQLSVLWTSSVWSKVFQQHMDPEQNQLNNA
ncbi:hypothetical protein OJAV_G00220660 [Oryzias javanicus]|uniref:Uncharacterized protein n=1 Tax=Oryzias javanicus TaxID=123683 RepID=A0A3S2PN98_ORYJA|nr:hypothetical protein OJAV_G00220660 [Oryzias javanicus]